MVQKNKVLVICGPTAAGKTSLAVGLGKQFKGELISADSRQVYKGMDIGTGKDLPKNAEFRIKNKELGVKERNYTLGHYFFDDIPVWLLDIVKPGYRFSVADYVKCANVVIQDIWQRGKLPILVGGTGFYIKAVIGGIGSLGVEPDWELRRELEKYSLIELQKRLKKLAPERFQKMNQSDQQNPRRLIRAIEIALAGGQKSDVHSLKADILMIGLKAGYKILYQRIDKRVKARIKRGIKKEIEALLRSYTFDNSVLGTTLGYQEWRPFFEKKETEDEVIQKWKFAEHAYARRQMTWFRKALRRAQDKNKKIIWFDITKRSFEKKIAKRVREWYS